MGRRRLLKDNQPLLARDLDLTLALPPQTPDHDYDYEHDQDQDLASAALTKWQGGSRVRVRTGPDGPLIRPLGHLLPEEKVCLTPS